MQELLNKIITMCLEPKIKATMTWTSENGCQSEVRFSPFNQMWKSFGEMLGDDEGEGEIYVTYREDNIVHGSYVSLSDIENIAINVIATIEPELPSLIADTANEVNRMVSESIGKDPIENVQMAIDSYILDVTTKMTDRWFPKETFKESVEKMATNITDGIVGTVMTEYDDSNDDEDDGWLNHMGW